MEVNNREWALAIWLGVVIVIVLLMPGGRTGVRDVLHIFFGRQILVPFVLLVGYTGTAVAALIGFGVWDAKLVTPTIVWFLAVAFVNFLRLPRAMKEAGFFRRLALSAVAAPVLVQFAVDLYPFSLWQEVLLQGAFLLFGILAAFAATRPEWRTVQRFFNVLIGILVAAVIIHSVAEIVAQWSKMDFVGEAKKFLLPIGMTAAFLPFMYGLTLYAAYESALSLMRATVENEVKLTRPVIGLAVRTGLSVRRLTDVTQSTRFAMARASSIREAIAIFDEGRAAEATRLQRASDKKKRLIVNAGLQGMDQDGKRLDQQEFEETKAALSHLHLCMAGHYQNSGRYRDDMLEYLGAETFLKKGLPADPRIALHLSPNGQHWWAWRRTVSGWVFAIGACEAPNDRWEYDGPDVPSGGPGRDPRWRHFMVPAEPYHHW